MQCNAMHSIITQVTEKKVSKIDANCCGYCDYDTYGCCFLSNSCILAVKAMTWSDSCAIASSFILSRFLD